MRRIVHGRQETERRCKCPGHAFGPKVLLRAFFANAESEKSRHGDVEFNLIRQIRIRREIPVGIDRRPGVPAVVPLSQRFETPFDGIAPPSLPVPLANCWNSTRREESQMKSLTHGALSRDMQFIDADVFRNSNGYPIDALRQCSTQPDVVSQKQSGPHAPA